MKNFIRFNEILDYKKYISLISELEKLKVYIQKYNNPFCAPNYPCWIKYENERNLKGSISITSNLYKLNFLNDALSNIATDLNNSSLGKKIFFKKTKINFIKTNNEVGIHKDQGNRITALNIGLMNSNQGTTRFSLDNSLENFYKNTEELIINDGEGVIINAEVFHSVSHNSNQDRYLITYNLGKSFQEIKKMLEE